VTAPDAAGGVVLDVAAVVAIVGDLLAKRPNGSGGALYARARAEGLTLAVPYIAARKAEAVYLDGPAAAVLGAMLWPEHYRERSDPLRASGPRGVWYLDRRRPERFPKYSEFVGRIGDPVTAMVAALAEALGWPVATDRPELFAELLGRDDALPVPELPAV
jgi:hypothetical protein